MCSFCNYNSLGHALTMLLTKHANIMFTMIQIFVLAFKKFWLESNIICTLQKIIAWHRKLGKGHSEQQK
jgi:hypothetical protein